MDDRERSILRRSRSLFIRDLVDVVTVCDRLYQREVLSEGMKNEILSETTRENQIRTLMDIIPKRGQKAYGAFYDVLEETYQYNLASILYPGGRPNTTPYPPKAAVEPRQYVGLPKTPLHNWLTGAKREPMESIGEFQAHRKPVESLDDDLVVPNWPSEQNHAQSMDFQIRLSQRPQGDSKEDELAVYRMKEATRGRLVIINNFLFGDEVDKERMARSQQDATSLDVLFKQLHFQTKQHSNLTLKNLSSVLEGERTRDHASLECFVMVIMSRGDGERLYGVDGYKIDIDTIISMFDSEHCSYLRGKPKVFIFQTCSDAPKTGTAEFQKKSKTPTSSSSLTLEDSGDLRADMFVVKATKDVEVSYNGVFGSRFIQSLVYLLRNLVCEEDFEEIVKKINHLNVVSEPEIVEYTSSFTKKLFFNP
uniref:Caspase-2 n=1 Tax=Magallana gigas TaxID=29159 RepID=A0A8W8KFG8_MAGGI